MDGTGVEVRIVPRPLRLSPQGKELGCGEAFAGEVPR